MKINDKRAPARGMTLFESQMSSELQWKTPLTVRITTELMTQKLIGDEDRDKLEVVCEEALKNAIIHGNHQNPNLSIRVRVFCDEKDWGIEIEDQGDGFSEERIPNPDDPNFVWMEHGRGIHLMQHVMDDVEYFSSGRQVVLTMRRAPDSALSAMPGKKISMGPHVRIVERNGALVAHVEMPIRDENIVDAVFKSITSALTKEPRPILVLDLSRVGYMTSHTIGRLVSLYKSCARTKVKLCLSGVATELKEVFLQMHLSSLFPCYERVEEAVPH